MIRRLLGENEDNFVLAPTLNDLSGVLRRRGALYEAKQIYIECLEMRK